MHNKLANSHSPSSPHWAGRAVPVRELHAGYKQEILNHLLQLNDEDRRLRFGTQTPDEVIRHYVEGLDFNRDVIFGVFNLDLELVGMAHLAYLPERKGEARAAEFGVSVLPEGRSQGLGTALLQRSAVHSRNTNIETLYVHCLANNKAMMHLAQKAGMTVEYAYGDADACLKLPPANTATIVEEAANEQWAGMDYALKENLKRSNEAWWWFLGRPGLAR
ncbi:MULTISPECIES: GNAT family N-acetyltransferase [unclassified Polynucleobacter]|uniref:GNAT family N-acetyltransferase n=1 Tax=unclassified Polynucleobacter TaxID=2640945 RepID=UPI001BFD181B|nr:MULTISPECIES: GNAT family N-acetyltransferase [unclassified Polynucleobacter]MEA9602925.1 GNAT family N-acetyltransferase [Polynucleobacter sp. JS-JIR-II-c23]QWE02562.1 GNAT family N-acetyltransferase [Polynucleobacter sp. JS-JIR-II-b4]